MSLCKCDFCGAEEDTPASIGLKCFFCKTGIMKERKTEVII